MVICLEPDADLRMAQLMPLPLTVSCFSKIQIGFTFLVPAHPGSLGKGPLNGSLYYNFCHTFVPYTLRCAGKTLLVFYKSSATTRSAAYV